MISHGTVELNNYCYYYCASVISGTEIFILMDIFRLLPSSVDIFRRIAYGQ
jgi:hypothetical protein